MTTDYHRVPMLAFRPDATLYAAIEAQQRPGESLHQTAKRLVEEAIMFRTARAACDAIGPPTTTRNDDGTFTHTWSPRSKP